MSSNKTFLSLCLIVTLATAGIVGCTKTPTQIGVSSEKYNTLVDKHNALIDEHAALVDEEAASETVTSAYSDMLDESHQASESFRDYIKAFDAMNSALSVFSQNVLKYRNFSDEAKLAQYDVIKKQYVKGNNDILDVQKLLIKQYNDFFALADDVYERGSDVYTSMDVNNRKSKIVTGISEQHSAMMALVEDMRNLAAENMGQETSNSVAPPKQIVLSEVETQVGAVSTGAGLSMDASGQLSTMTAEQFRAEARSRGYDTSTIESSQEMAASMNGVVGMACTNKDLVQVLNNLVSHMKSKANLNSDDLEIALAIDYSQSMSNNIEVVMKQLEIFVESVSNVKNSGRRVKVGISTFGLPGRELVELDLTSDIGEVQAQLSRLLINFSSNNHSEPQGEASYYGLMKTSEMSWKSLNRQTIVITDEPSYSILTGDTAYIASVEKAMKSMNVYPLMVRICN